MLFITSSTGLQKEHAQIENETSTVFEVERFYEYLYGCRFIVISYHKPLKSIFNKSLFPSLLVSRNFAMPPNVFLQDIEILVWCPAGSVLPHKERVLL